MVISRTRIIAIFFLTLVLAGGLWVLYGLWAVRGIESPSYTVKAQYENFEVREYEDLILASTTVSGDLENSRVEGFKKIAAYIFGENTLGQEIAMTAPVSTEQVKNSSNDTEYTISFVMPHSYSMQDLPLPTDSQVRVLNTPQRKVAVLTYYGTVNETVVAEKMAFFASELEKAGYKYHGEMILTEYNPPFTPWFLRKNEVWAVLLDTD
jgi:hypothetical protein